MRQIVWGLFKKVVIADGCAKYVAAIFENYSNYSGSTLFLGVMLFAFQIYGDFSGYSDIAIGTARLFGFNLMRNFAFPYFSRDIAEFWRRWHISLSTWFRDYVYIPLGGSRGNTWMKVRNTLIIFLVSGFWHGANWTYLIWGFLNAVYFLPLLMLNLNRSNVDIVTSGRFFPRVKDFLQIVLTFFLTNLAWVFFRSPSIKYAFGYLNRMFTKSFISFPKLIEPKSKMVYTLFMIIILVLAEWSQRDKEHALQIEKLHKTVRWGIYFSLFMLIFFFGVFEETQFIYFQF